MHTIKQFSYVGALLSGYNCADKSCVGGVVPANNHGLGTFNSLDGECVIYQGKMYQVEKGGEAKLITDMSINMPFYVASTMDYDNCCAIGANNFSSLSEELLKNRLYENTIASIFITGHFDEISLRAICKVPRGTKLSNAVEFQSNYTLKNIQGYLIGFYFPKFIPSVNVPGFHLHFLSEDLTKGGHVLDFNARDLKASILNADKFNISLPSDMDFKGLSIPVDPSKELDAAENARKS